MSMSRMRGSGSAPISLPFTYTAVVPCCLVAANVGETRAPMRAVIRMVFVNMGNLLSGFGEQDLMSCCDGWRIGRFHGRVCEVGHARAIFLKILFGASVENSTSASRCRWVAL